MKIDWHGTVPPAVLSKLSNRSAGSEAELVGQLRGIQDVSSVSTGLTRERSEGDGKNLAPLVDGIKENYGSEGPPGQQGKGGPPGQQDKQAQAAEAQAAVNKNNESAQEAANLGQESYGELAKLSNQGRAIRSGPEAGPRKARPNEVSRQVQERTSNSTANLKPTNLQPAEQQPKPAELPSAKKGQTRVRLDLEEGEPGKQQAQEELEEQRQVRIENQENQQKSEQLKPTVGRLEQDIKTAQTKALQDTEKDKKKLAEGEQEKATDQRAAAEAEQLKTQAKADQRADQDRVQKDRSIVETDRTQVSTAKEAVGTAETELKEAGKMRQKADQKVQEASRYKPGNGNGNAGGNGKGKGAGSPGKGNGKGKGANGQGNGRGNVWRKVLASAKDFQKKASTRQALGISRKRTAQANVNAAKDKLERDNKGLAKSQDHLQQSTENLKIRDADSQSAKKNVGTSLKKVKDTKQRLSKMATRVNSLRDRLTQIREGHRVLDTNTVPLKENLEKGLENENRLAKEVKAPQVKKHTVELQELTVGVRSNLQTTPG